MEKTSNEEGHVEEAPATVPSSRALTGADDGRTKFTQDELNATYWAT